MGSRCPPALWATFLCSVALASGPAWPAQAVRERHDPAPASGQTHRSSRRPSAGFDRFIVAFAPGKAPERLGQHPLLDGATDALPASARLDHLTAGGMHVVVTSRPLDDAQAQAFMNRLRRQPTITYVARDRRLRPHLAPNDPQYAQQWNLGDGQLGAGGIRAPGAWNRALGLGVLVAVIDTGVTPHPDLDAHLVPGRDFVTDVTIAGDGDGRDADPADPGDWNDAEACGAGTAARPSSWHGTHMAGVIAALTDNGLGVAGVAPDARVMPLRVLGHCGGWSSDVADAIEWAAGGTVAGLPLNPNPADVISLSLGGEEPCIAPLQAAIDHANAAGVVVVASAGNSGGDAGSVAPASCRGVVVVTATDGYGEMAWYSNRGPAVDLAAPGGSGGSVILSTHNSGSAASGTPTYFGMTGTSPAAAQVSGVIALMQSAAPTSPESVEAILTATARPLLAPCLYDLCGAGTVDASAAVDAALDGAISVTDAHVSEGSQGLGLVSFEVRLSRPMPGPVNFDLATADGITLGGIAVSGSDFQSLSLPGQSFAPGTTSRRYSVLVQGDALPEPDETFRVLLTNVQGVAVARSTGTVLLANDDAIPLVNGVPVGPLGSDLVGTRRLYSLEVPPGATKLTFTSTHQGGIVVVHANHGSPPQPGMGDCVVEDWFGETICNFDDPLPGTWYLMLYSMSYFAATISGTYTSAALPVLSIGDASAREGHAGTGVLAFPVQLSQPAAMDVSFEVSTGNGTAIAGSDYVARVSDLHSISAGQTSSMVEVVVIGDGVVEGNESFTVDLASVQGASMARAQAMGRIANDDLATLSVGDIAIVETDASSTATFTVSVSAPMPSPVTFDIRTIDGSAKAGSDYVARRLTGRYLDSGRTRQSFEVILVGDEVAEASEAFSVVIENVAGAVPGDVTGIASVADDDTAAPTRAAAPFRTTPRKTRTTP